MSRAFKGISPLVATFLLIAFTLVIAGILAGWATQIATQQRIAAEYCADAAMMIRSASYDTSTSTLTLIVENFGKVDLNFTVVYVFANGTGGSVGQIFASPKNTLTPVNFAISPDIEEVTIRSTRCPAVSDTISKRSIKNLF